MQHFVYDIQRRIILYINNVNNVICMTHGFIRTSPLRPLFTRTIKTLHRPLLIDPKPAASARPGPGGGGGGGDYADHSPTFSDLGCCTCLV